MVKQTLMKNTQKFITMHTIAVIAVAVIMTACSSTGKSFSICQEGTEDPPLELHWKELPETDSLTVLATSQLPLILRNKTTQTLFVTISVAGALDAIRDGVSLGAVIIPPLTEINVAFDLSQFNFNIVNLKFSGRIVARATARKTPEGPVEHLAYTPHAFVHMEEDKIHAYRVKPMLEKFGAGDFGNRVEGFRQWAKKRGIKLVGIGHFARNLQFSDNDGGPMEEN